MSQLGTPQRSAQIWAPVTILKIKKHCNDPAAPRSREGHPSVTDLWKSLAAQQGGSQVQASRVSAKDTHTCDGIVPWARIEGEGEVRMIGRKCQPHTDTQQADVTDCMIRERAGSQGTERNGIFRELCHPSEISPRLGLNTTHTESLLCSEYDWRTISWLIGKMCNTQRVAFF